MFEYCPYCFSEIELSKDKYGYKYKCTNCDAYVGCHPNTTKSLGTLANKKLRRLRHEAHKYFDMLWGNAYQRSKMYHWLSNRLNLDIQKTHIGMFNEWQCMQVIKLSKEKFRK